MMEVLHVIPYMHPRAGGPPVVADRVCRRLARHGWNCRLATTDTLAREQSLAWAAPLGDGYEFRIFRSRGPASFAFSRELAAEMGDLVAASRLVHIHAAWTFPAWAAMRACRRHRVPFVVMPHGMFDPESLGRKWLRKQLYGRWIQWPNTRAAAAMIYTHAEEQCLAERSVPGLPPGFVVPLGADAPPDRPREALAEAILQRFPRLRGRRLVLFLGRLHPIKGLELLIGAFRHVASRYDDAWLLLVGPGEADYVEALERLVESEGLTGRTTFTGPLAGRAKWEALAAASLLVLPSYHENFALAVAEAMRAALPVVLSRHVHLGADVAEAGAGTVCELSVPAIAAAVCRYLGDPLLAAEAGCRGQRMAAEKFAWDRTAAALDAIYRQVLNL